jgi:hypothetical protein
MKTVDEKRFEMLSEYALSGFEMFNVRGGDDGGDGGEAGDGDGDGEPEPGDPNGGDEPSDPERPGQIIVP